MYYLCEMYYKPITVQYYIADRVSWVPRLTLLDLTNKLDLMNMLSKQNLFEYRGLTVFTISQVSQMTQQISLRVSF